MTAISRLLSQACGILIFDWTSAKCKQRRAYWTEGGTCQVQDFIFLTVKRTDMEFILFITVSLIVLFPYSCLLIMSTFGDAHAYTSIKRLSYQDESPVFKTIHVKGLSTTILSLTLQHVYVRHGEKRKQSFDARFCFMDLIKRLLWH